MSIACESHRRREVSGVVLPPALILALRRYKATLLHTTREFKTEAEHSSSRLSSSCSASRPEVDEFSLASVQGECVLYLRTCSSSVLVTRHLRKEHLGHWLWFEHPVFITRGSNLRYRRCDVIILQRNVLIPS